LSTQSRHIFLRYPEKKAQIWRQMLRNAEFRRLCIDYGKCIEAIDYWDRSTVPDAKAKADEYRYLSSVLEKEFIEALAHEVQPTDNDHH
jgi:hypothetical protein